MQDDILMAMYEDDYYATELVDKLHTLLMHFANKIQNVRKYAQIYILAQESIQQINLLKPQFEFADCALDDVAADYIKEAMMMIVQEAEFLDIDGEELMINKEW